MARIPEHVIETVRQTSDIYDVISEYVNLKKRGRNFFGLCPFHYEKTPSFSINMDKQIYKCFGCNKGGGTINFIMDIERLDFVDALKFLGKKYNIDVEFEHNSKSSKDLFNQLYSMHEFAKDFYTKNLTKDVIELLAKRNINQQSITDFGIGLSLNNYEDLLQKIRKEQFSSEALKKSGLFIDNEKGYMDRFRNRIMFPIYNHFNKIIGFAGRIYNDNNKMAKYMNSPETPIYNKSKILYGMNLNRNQIIEEQSVIVVEGYLDLIQLYQANIKNVVAISGTAFTNQHATVISKICNKIYLAYDGDQAGIDAAIRAGYIILRNKLEPKIIEAPDGMDPDDWVKNEGPEPFKNAIEHSKTLLEFHYETKSKAFNEERDKINFINEVLSELINIDDPLNIEILIKELAHLTDFSIDSILSSFKIAEKNKKQYYKKRDDDKTLDNNKNQKISTVEKELISFCFTKDQKLRTIIKKNLDVNWLQSDLIKEIYNQIYIHLSSVEMVEPEIIMNELLDENVRNLMAQLIFDEMNPNKNIIIDCLCRIEQNVLQNKLNKLRNDLKEKIIDEEQSMKTVQLIETLQKDKNNLKTKYIDA